MAFKFNPFTGKLDIAGSGGGAGTVTSITAGTGLTGGTITTSGTIAIDSTVVVKDANNNISANAFFNNFATIVASGTQVVLTAASAPFSLVTGSGGQTIKLPDATTLPNGAIFIFNNNQSSGAILVNNNSNTLVVSIPSGGYVEVILNSNAIPAGTWDRHDLSPSNVSWSTNTFDYPGSITSATWNGNTVAANRGGTGQSSAFVAGGIAYGSSTSALGVTPIGTIGQVLTSAGAGTPTWTTPTTITTGSVDNAILRANGTGGATLQNSPINISDLNTSLQTTVAIGPDRSTFSITGDATTDIITATGHNFVTNQAVSFPTITGGAGLNATTRYFVRDVTVSTFKVSTTIGGGAIDFTTNITAGSVQSSASLVLLQGSRYGLESIQTAIPDGTVVGGNARGLGSVDLQMYRNAASDIANSDGAFLGPGYGSSAGQYAAAIACYETRATGQYSIAGGRSQQATSQYSIAFGGFNNQATTSNYPTTIGGVQNLSTGNSAGILAGQQNEASASFAGILAGNQGSANRYAMQAHAAGQFAAKGDAQRARFVLRCATTTNTGVEMALDGATTYLSIPLDKAFFCNIKIVGIRDDGSAVATYERQYAVKNVTGTSSEIYAPITIGTDNAAGTTIALSANNADDTLRILVTGVASQNWRWVASIDAVEVKRN
jgi:hypothetical protein